MSTFSFANTLMQSPYIQNYYPSHSVLNALQTQEFLIGDIDKLTTSILQIPMNEYSDLERFEDYSFVRYGKNNADRSIQSILNNRFGKEITALTQRVAKDTIILKRLELEHEKELKSDILSDRAKQLSALITEVTRRINETCELLTKIKLSIFQYELQYNNAPKTESIKQQISLSKIDNKPESDTDIMATLTGSDILSSPINEQDINLSGLFDIESVDANNVDFNVSVDKYINTDITYKVKLLVPPTEVSSGYTNTGFEVIAFDSATNQILTDAELPSISELKFNFDKNEAKDSLNRTYEILQ